MSEETLSDQQEFRQTTSNAGLIGVSTFSGAIAGFILNLLTAYYFGAGAETDAYIMAQSTSELLSKLLMGGSITAVFIPMFVERLISGKKQNAWELALNILHITGMIYLVLIVLLAVFAEQFVAFTAPGFTAEMADLTVSLLRVLLPSFFFLFLVDIATAMLHSLKHFKLPALLRIIAPTISIITIIVAVRSVGIYALAIGAVGGSIIQCALLFRALRRQGFSYMFILSPRDPAIRKLALLVYPFIFAVLVTQSAGIVYRILASELAVGSLSSIKYAERITQLLTNTFMTSLTIVMYPLLSEKAAKSDYIGMRRTLSSAISLLIFVTVPLVIGVVLLREPLIEFIYGRGSFTEEDVRQTSTALLFLIIGLTTNGISSMFGHTVLALKQTPASVAVTISSQVIAISLFVLLVPRMGLAGLALASSLVPLSTALLYFLYLTRYIPNLQRVFYHTTLLKTVVLALLLAAAVFFTREWTAALTPFTEVNTLLQLVIPTGVGILVFFGIAHLWRIHEMSELLAIASGKLQKLKRVS